MEPGVVTGADVVAKEVYLSDSELGSITDLRFGNLDGVEGMELGVAGTSALKIYSPDGTEKLAIGLSEEGANLPSPPWHIEIVDVEGDGVCEFMLEFTTLLGGPLSHTVELWDHSGSALWKYEAKALSHEVSAGDMNGDKVLEFLVSAGEYQPEVAILNSQGVQLKKIRIDYPGKFAPVDFNQDGKSEIAVLESENRLRLLDLQERTVGYVRLPSSLDSFAVVSFEDRKPLIAGLGEDTIYLTDFEGRKAIKLKIDDLPTIVEAELTGIGCQLKANAEPYIAISLTLGMFPPFERSALFILDASGRLVYRENLGRGVRALATMRNPQEEGAETLLAGVGGKVLAYTLRANETPEKNPRASIPPKQVGH